MSKKAREFIACKRTKSSIWQYAEYSEMNDKAFDAIAPDGGNYLKLKLIEYSELSTLKAKLEKAEQKAMELEVEVHDLKNTSQVEALRALREVDKMKLDRANEMLEKMAEALRGSLGWFALFNDENNRKKWPPYISKCEATLKQYEEWKRK